MFIKDDQQRYKVVNDVVIDPSAAAIVTSIVAIARSLGLSTVAEGVETLEQLELVKG